MVSSLYSSAQESKAIWLFLEVYDGLYEGVSLELISKGRQLCDQIGWQLAGLLLGHKLAGLAKLGFAHGLDEIWLADDVQLEQFTIEAYSHAAFHALMQGRPSVFLLGATPNGRDLAGRLAVRMKTGLNADCTNLDLDLENERLVCEVSGFGGGILALIEMAQHRPQMATVRPGVFSPSQPDFQRTGRIVHPSLNFPQGLIRTRRVEQNLGEGVDLTQVPILVAGGRGVDGDFEMLAELANLLGGDIGATRPPVDEGYVERERQIGQTGVVCRPKIAICCGISGAFHFIVGVEKADIVVAINSDPEAPIFDYVDYGIVGDVHKIVPNLIEALSEKREAAVG